MMTALLSLIYRKIMGESLKDRQIRKLGKINIDLAEKNNNQNTLLVPPPTYAEVVNYYSLAITGTAIKK